MLKNIINNEDGQGMVEYGLILGLIAVVAIVVIATLGDKIKDLFQGASDTLASNLPETT